ncbi:hypothetical protein BBX46_02020 [Lacticaseibacillus paracasei]|uniref:hypothetical protein n=1 Tax=Lacticaseibacillus paracasei TaxID=1597 RepID=UPI0008DE0A0F|nr:hypothetical protein BBX46_02020 [Lacticaseibacillus paracasei]
MKRTLGICSAMLVVLGLVGCQSNSADNSPKQETSSKHQTKTESEHSSKAKLAASKKKPKMHLKHEQILFQNRKLR